MQIAPSIYALRHTFRIPVAPGILLGRFVYSYLVYGESITLIDTGVAGCEEQIFASIWSAGRDSSEIALIILTHSHPDHMGAARAVQQVTRCSIAAHPAEMAWIEDVERQNSERPVPGFDTLVGGSVRVVSPSVTVTGRVGDDVAAVAGSAVLDAVVGRDLLMIAGSADLG
ncbi:MAG: MBL fold metallo-hydrolase, partial [Methanomicrobiaceae archaeon]|nr:MBL fold metallo-hydrolase [Methanomicrobiaceae archaeon]